MQFLFTKSWHTQSQANVRKVWEAEQRAKAEEAKMKALLLERQKEMMKEKHMKQQAKGDKIAQKAVEVGFLYSAPSGIPNSVKQQLPGVVENVPLHPGNPDDGQGDDDDGSGILNADDGKKSKKLTMVEKFPFLANAPGLRNTDLASKESFIAKPFGIEMRNVRCVRCKQWGHQMGDRQCPLKGVASELSETLHSIQDPLTLMSMQEDKKSGIRLKLPEQGVYGKGRNSELQQFLTDDIDAEHVQEVLMQLRQEQARDASKSGKKVRVAPPLDSSSLPTDGKTSRRVHKSKSSSKHERQSRSQPDHKSKHRHKHKRKRQPSQERARTNLELPDGEPANGSMMGQAAFGAQVQQLTSGNDHKRRKHAED